MQTTSFTLPMHQPPPFEPPYTSTHETAEGIRVTETLALGTTRDITSTSHGQYLIKLTRTLAARRDGSAGGPARVPASDTNLVPGNSRAMVFLDVPFAEKDSAKGLGAKWDAAKRKWYVPHELDINLFDRWWPDALKQK